MKKLRWPLLVVLLSLAAIAIILLSQQQVSTPGSAPVLEPSSGGIYAEGLIGAPVRFNPVLDYYNSADRDVDRLIYSSLVRFDDRGLAQGDLAEAWASSKDGKVYSFALRPNALWHDGKPVTADDVIFTIDLMRNDQIPLPADLREFWKQVNVSALNPQTVRFDLPEAFAPFLDYLSFGILPRHVYEGIAPQDIANAPQNLNPVGSGPFMFDHLLVENGKIQGVVLKTNPKYYSKPSFIEQVVLRYYPDANAALEAYRKGDVMGISQATPDILPQVLSEQQLNAYTARLPRLVYVYLNLQNDRLTFFQQANIRRALLLGINRQRIIDRLLGGQAIPADGPIWPDSWAYYPGIEHVPYDPQAADELIKKAGFTYPADGSSVRVKDGVALEFDLVFPDTPIFQQVAQMIQSDWAKVGVRANLKPVTNEQLVKDYLEPRNYQAALVDLNLTRLPDPDPYPFWHQTQVTDGQNYSGWDDRQASEYLERARTAIDLDERTRLYRNFQVRFTNEMPALPLYFLVYTYAVDDQVQAVRLGPLYDTGDRFNSIENWFLVARRATPVPLTPTP